MVAGALLIVGRADHGHQNTQQNTDAQGQGRGQQGGADALQILEPPVVLQKRLIELYIKFLEKSDFLTQDHQGFPLLVGSSQIHRRSPRFSIE